MVEKIYNGLNSAPANHERNLFLLHPAQEDVYYDQLLMGNPPKYTIGGYTHAHYVVDLETFQKSWELLYGHLDALRLKLVEQDGAPRQYIQQGLKANAVTYKDFSDFTDPESQAMSWIHQQANEFIPYEQSQLSFAWLLKIAPEHYMFVFFAHHICIDGIGCFRLFEYIFQAYHDLKDGRSFDWLKQLPQYKPVVEKAHTYLKTDAYQTNQQFFKSLLAQHESYQFPIKRDVEGNDRYLLTFSENMTRAIKEHCKCHEINVLAVFSGICALVLSKTLNKSDFLLNTVVHGRQGKEGLHVVGMHTNTLPFSVSVQPDDSFLELAQALKNSIHTSYNYGNYPFSHFGRLANRLGMLVPEITLAYDRFSAGNNSRHFTETYSIDNDYQDHPLLIRLRDYGSNDKMQIAISYGRRFFDAEEIETLTHRLELAFKAMLASPEQKVIEASLLLPGEKERLLEAFNPDELAYPDSSTLHGLFSQQVVSNPDAIALQFEGGQISYAQLDIQSNQLANAIQATYRGKFDKEMPVDTLMLKIYYV